MQLSSGLKCYLIVILFRHTSWSVSDKQDWSGAGCPPPEVAVNGTVLVDIRDEKETDYSNVTEVKFSGEIGPLREKRMCKIKCSEGQWVGPLCQNDDDTGHYSPLFKNCKLGHAPPHVIVTYKNVTVTPGFELPHRAIVKSRCKLIGVYKLMGDSSIVCENGAWSNRIPACIPTTIVTNFTEDAPPSILIRIPTGSASVEPSGELAVYPGTNLHLECIFSRRLGNPEWTWTSAFRSYLTGWAIAPDEREWKYRLSIYYSKPQDSGVYVCSTPRGLTNSITVHVTAVHCEAFEVEDPFLTYRMDGVKLGQMAIFQCPLGFKINGTSNLTCQASGKWSDLIPNCVQITCPNLETDDPHITMVEHNTSYGGRAVFRCSWGYRLIGAPGLECEVNGSWSGSIPRCLAIQCPQPLPPINGHLVDEGSNYKVGTTVKFACNEHHQLVGESTIICTETGFWSHPPPFCRPRCPYPGEPENGRIAPVKFSYEPGDHLKVTCNAGYVVRIDAMPQCLPDGTWSEELPECRSYHDV